MTEGFEYIDRIEDYLLHRMTERQIHDFEAELETNKALAEEFSVLSAFIEAVKEKDSLSLKEKLQQKEKEIKIYVGKKGFSPFRMVAVLLVLICIAALLKYTVFNIPIPEKEQVAREYKINDPGVPVLMSDDSFNREFNRAMSKYQKGEFDTAQILFHTLMLSDPRNDTLLFYEGISAFENKDYNVAVTDFERIISFKNSEYNDKTEYWLGLCYLANDETGKAKMLFEKIIENPKHIYYEKARAILAEKVFEE